MTEKQPSSNKQTVPGPDQHLKTYEDSVCIVTGGASGIGRAIAETLADKKARAIVLLDRQVTEAEALADTLKADHQGLDAKAYEVDVRNYSDVERAVKETKETYGRLDYMFNNAGVIVGAALEKMSVEDFDYVIDVNVRGVSNGTFAAYPIMKEQGFGHIVNTASLGGLMPSIEGTIAYVTSKFAIVGMTKNLRIEAARHGVRASVLCPAFVRTPMLEGGGKYGRFMDETSKEDWDEFMKKVNPMDPKKFAERALKLVTKNKPIIILPGHYKFDWFLDRLSPSFGLCLTRMVNAKVMTKAEEDKDDKKQEAIDAPE